MNSIDSVNNNFLPLTGFPKEFDLISPGLYRFTLLADQLKKIRRISIPLNPPVDLSQFTDLFFSIGAHDPDSLSCNLVDGDKGFPEIRIFTADNCIYRFKRGNIKDFFDIQEPLTLQSLDLPLAYFIYDNDSHQNSPQLRNISTSLVSKITFDFLPHPNKCATINFGNVKLGRVDRVVNSDPNFSLEVIPAAVHDRLCGFLTFNGKLSIQITLKNNGNLDTSNLVYLITVEDLSSSFFSTDRCEAVLGKVYKEIQLPHLGSYLLKIELLRDFDSILVTFITNVGYAIRSSDVRTGILGISDSQFENEIGLMGGCYQRRIIGISTLGQKNNFGIKMGVGPLPTCVPFPAQNFIISLKAMPSWLSTKSGKPDAYRWAPSNWDTYSSGIKHLAYEMKNANCNFLETWNESSVLHEWADSIENLILLHKVTYFSAKNVHPSLIVIGGTTHTYDHKFLEKFIKSGGLDHCDAIGIHGYTYQPENIGNDIRKIREIVDAYGAKDFPIYITEVGFRTPAFTLLNQARHLVRTTLHASSIPCIKSVLWFRMQNITAEDTGYDQNASTGYAMIGYNKNYVRPVALAYSFLLRFLNTFPTSEFKIEDCQEFFSFSANNSFSAQVVDGYLNEKHLSFCKAKDGCIALNMFGAKIKSVDEAFLCNFGPIFMIPSELENVLSR